MKAFSSSARPDPRSAKPAPGANSTDPGAGAEPLSPPVFHILLALAAEECHGYGIMKAVEASTEGRVRLGPGTLYGVLKRLLEAGWIEEAGDREESDGGGVRGEERRRYYRLSGLGQRVAAAEARRLAGLVEQARSRGLLDGEENDAPLNGGAPAHA